VGISLNLTPFHSVSASDADRAAAQTADQIINRLFLDPLFRGSYPEPYWTKLRLFQPKVRPGDMAVIARPIDFLGINYYTRARVRYSRLVPLLKLWPAGLPAMTGRDSGEDGVAYSQMGWEVYPGGLFELLFRIKQEYSDLPLYVTENGAAFVDVVAADGHIHDEPRREYLEQHLAVTSAAARAGVDVRGYFVWSLIDNFEWTHGYNRRFGIVHVDFDSQRRTIKDSGYWFADLIKRQKAAWEMSGETALGGGN
jgi:beta-glucosidase